jgi:hypothetical protein
LVMMCNNYVNLYIFRKHFPDKLISSDLKKVHTLLFIFCILFSLFLLMQVRMNSLIKRENYNSLTKSIRSFGSES